jgi:predicted  nucleic acid-binding Zn-ribbon protein
MNMPIMCISVKAGPHRPSERRSHTIAYRSILHKLLDKAEEEGVYKNIFETSPAFQELTKKIKDQYLVKNGSLMKEFGRLLIEALDLCHQHQTSFEDYIERVLTMQRTQAKSIMKIFALDMDPQLGFDNMKIASGIKDPEQRKKVEEMFYEGKSQDEARAFIREHKVKPDETYKHLEAEKRRIEKSLVKLQERLQEVEEKLQAIGD